jgi:hypothetical protein
MKKSGSGAEPEGVMISGVTAFLAAVGGASLICYLLMNRRPNRGVRRQGASGDSAYSGASYDSGSSGRDGWNVFSWFSSDTSASDNSGASGDWSGSDSGGGGGDSGGGGGDGGGGGGD